MYSRYAVFLLLVFEIRCFGVAVGIIYVINGNGTQKRIRNAANAFRVLKLKIHVYFSFNSIDGSGE